MKGKVIYLFIVFLLLVGFFSVTLIHFDPELKLYLWQLTFYPLALALFLFPSVMKNNKIDFLLNFVFFFSFEVSATLRYVFNNSIFNYIGFIFIAIFIIIYLAKNNKKK